MGLLPIGALVLGGARVAEADTPDHSAALFIRSGVDSAGSCRVEEAFSTALRRLLPGVAIQDHGHPGGDDLIVAFIGEAHVLQLAIRSADDRLLLSRRLPYVDGDDCRGLARTAAFVVDRFLSELEWPGMSAAAALVLRPAAAAQSDQAVRHVEGAGARAAPSSAGPATAARAPIRAVGQAALPTVQIPRLPPLSQRRVGRGPTAAAATDALVQAAALPPVANSARTSREHRERQPDQQRDWQSHWRVDVGASAASDRIRLPGLASAVGLHWASGLRVQLHGLLYPAAQQRAVTMEPANNTAPTTLGALVSRRAEVRMTTEWCLGQQGFACAGAVAGAQATWVAATGADLFQQRTSTAVHPVGGGHLSLGLRWPWNLETEFSLAGVMTLGQTKFVVDGVPDATVTTPAYGVSLTLRVGRIFF